ncbi:MAG TPA: hypothetical protein VGK59_15655 [Ohtaekwangia sp.]
MNIKRLISGWRINSSALAGSLKSVIYFLSVFILLIFAGCASYYQKNVDFNKEFETGDLKQALETLKKNNNEAHGRSRFLYFANNGLLLSILGKYTESNEAFEKAFLFGEDYRINYLQEAASYLTNPNMTMYRGEDHEHLMVLYFKAINFLKMNKPDDALVECRRLNIRLNQLSDKYASEEKFQRDAFVHTLMGIIYQSVKDYNNAFIAYRNAYEVYEGPYTTMFGMQVPEQLKLDLLNTAYWTGFKDEFERYKEKFQLMEYQPTAPDADLIFFWHNGLGPIKDEWSINFAIDHKADNVVVFNNPGIPVVFPFTLDDDKEKSDLASLEVFRVAFPRYVERPVYFQSGNIQLGDSTYALELAEDVNKVAFKSLQQRMLEEFSKGLLRAALKKAAEHSIRKDDEMLGALIGAVNAMTEKADTRNWQTLPHSIYYARIPLKEGTNSITFNLNSAVPTPTKYDFTYQALKGQTLFHTFSSLESTYPRYY